MRLGTNIIPRPQTKKPGRRTLKFKASTWPLGLQLILIYLILSQHHRNLSSGLQVALGDTILEWHFPPWSPVAVLCCWGCFEHLAIGSRVLISTWEHGGSQADREITLHAGCRALNGPGFGCFWIFVARCWVRAHGSRLSASPFDDLAQNIDVSYFSKEGRYRTEHRKTWGTWWCVPYSSRFATSASV